MLKAYKVVYNFKTGHRAVGKFMSSEDIQTVLEAVRDVSEVDLGFVTSVQVFHGH